MAFHNKRKIKDLSGFYVHAFMHNIGNAKNHFMFSMNLFESMRMQIFCEGVNMLNCFRTPVFKRLVIRIIEAGKK